MGTCSGPAWEPRTRSVPTHLAGSPGGDWHSPRVEAPRAETPGWGNSTVAGNTRTPTSGPARDEQELDNPTGRPEHARSSQPLQTTAPRAAGGHGGDPARPRLSAPRAAPGVPHSQGVPTHTLPPHDPAAPPALTMAARCPNRYGAVEEGGGGRPVGPPQIYPRGGASRGRGQGRGQHDFAPPLRGHAALWTRPPRPASTLIGRFESRQGWVGGDVRGVECGGREAGRGRGHEGNGRG